MKSHLSIYPIVVLVFALAVFSCRTWEKGSELPDKQVIKTITIDLPNLPEGVKPLEMVLIKPGEFTMGSPTTDRARLVREWSPHQVTLTRAFYLGMYEVTQAHWRAVMGTNPANDHGVGDDYPVHKINWNDCQVFIRRLNEMGKGTFRLPTEAEWEYVCRAGTTTRFSFGDALDCNDVRVYCGTYDKNMWWGGNNDKHGYPHGSKQVGLKLPNPWGLYDMHGNVWEWCSDFWQDPFSRGPQTDPQGPETGSRRVMRGGSWSSHALHLRSTDRSGIPPDDSIYTFVIGLRLLRSYP
ncbi:MAG: formylglycine-generating enzyme family protein [Sedimentisphaerales bacterium]